MRLGLRPADHCIERNRSLQLKRDLVATAPVGEDEVGMLCCEGDFAGIWFGDASQLSFTCAVVWDVKKTDTAAPA